MFLIIPEGAGRTKSLFAALVILGLSFASSPSKAADSRNVTVVNETGYAIKFLGFNAQDSTYVEFDDSEEGCVWNIKVIWADYDEAVLWKNVNLCKFTALRLRYDPGTKTTSFIAE